MAIPEYTPPILQVVKKDEYALPFEVIVGATAQLALSSTQIVFPYTVREVITYFPDDAINNVRAYWLVGTTNSTSTIAISEGSNLLAPLNPVGYLIGHADRISIALRRTVTLRSSYIKLHINNLNAYGVTVFGTVRIRVL